MTKSGYVYLVQAVGTSRYKIGRASDANKRFVDLKAQSPFPLKLITAFYVDDVVNQEKRLHQVASAFRVHGEWFELPEAWVNRLNEWFYDPQCFKYKNTQKVQLVAFVNSLGGDYELQLAPQPEPSPSGKPKQQVPKKLRKFAFGTHTYDQLGCAINLLGSISQGNLLRATKKKQLKEILGVYPSSAEEARAWKASLKKLRQDFEIKTPLLTQSDVDGGK